MAAPTKVAPIPFRVATGPGRSSRGVPVALRYTTPRDGFGNNCENHELTILIGDDGQRVIEGEVGSSRYPTNC